MTDIVSSFSDDTSFNDCFVHAFVCININRWLNYVRETLYCYVIAFYRINGENEYCAFVLFFFQVAIQNITTTLSIVCTHKQTLNFAILQLIIITWLSRVIMLMYHVLIH